MATQVLTADTSLVMPTLLVVHPEHQVSRAALVDVDALPSHVLLEAFSVLTRLPGGLATTPGDALRLIRSRFVARPLTLSADQEVQFLDSPAKTGLRGGQVYDALVATTARMHGARLLTRDRRAAATYEAMQAEITFVD